jgi:hypothetical protein
VAKNEGEPQKAVEDSLTPASAVVPSLWPLEVANALLVANVKNASVWPNERGNEW